MTFYFNSRFKNAKISFFQKTDIFVVVATSPKAGKNKYVFNCRNTKNNNQNDMYKSSYPHQVSEWFFVKECRKQKCFWTLRPFFNVKSRHLCIENDCMRMGPKNEELQKNLEILTFLGRFSLALEDDLYKASCTHLT